MTSHIVPLEKGELHRGAAILAVSFFGLLLSIGVLLVYPFGVFFQALAADFGWTRAQISAALTVSTFTLAVAGPVHGMLIDRFGARLLITISILGLGLGVSSLYFLTPSLLHLYLSFAAISLFGASASAIGYSRILIVHFDAKRGLALGLALAGAGVGAMVIPAIAQQLISHFGWRSAYLILGAAALTPLPLCLLIAEPSLGHKPAAAPSVEAAAGTDDISPARLGALLMLMGVFGAMGAVTIGMFAHFVPLLVDHSLKISNAATAAGGVGLAIICSRIVVGWAIDRMHGPLVLAAIALGLALAALLLILPTSGALLLLICILLGFGLGAEVDLLSFLVSRYWPRRSFGSIYGVLYGVFTLGAGIGPFLIGAAFDRDRDYHGALTGAALAAAVAAGLCLLLPRYQTARAASR